MLTKNRGNAEHYRWGGDCDGWRLLEGPDLSVIQERIPPGRGEVRHYHHHARQLFYVLQGQLQITLADQTVGLGAGDSLEVPPRQEHRVFNGATGDVLFLVISAPSTRGDRVEIERAP